jgi:hypothetical protein
MDVAALEADLTELRREGFHGAWCGGGGGNGLRIAVAVPCEALRLEPELCHALGLEPTSAVVVKLRREDGRRKWTPATGASGTPEVNLYSVRGATASEASLYPLLDASCPGCLPAWHFSLLKVGGAAAAAEEGGGGQWDAQLAEILWQGEDASEPVACTASTDFGARFAVQDILQQFFVSMLAAEQVAFCEPRGLAVVGHAHSLTYVRKLVNSGLSLDGNAEAQRCAMANLDGETQQCARDAVLAAVLTEQQNPLVVLPPPASGNQLLRLARFVSQQIATVTSFCLVCHEPMATRGHHLKPFVCSNPLCVHQYTELNLGANPETELTNNPEVVDLLVSLFMQHAQMASGSKQQWDTGKQMDSSGEADFLEQMRQRGTPVSQNG